AKILARAEAHVGDRLAIGILQQVVTPRFGARKLPANIDLVGLEDRQPRGAVIVRNTADPRRGFHRRTIAFSISFAVLRHLTPRFFATDGAQIYTDSRSEI